MIGLALAGLLAGGLATPAFDAADPATLDGQIRAWDAEAGFSSSARWRSVMGWRRLLATPLTWSATAPERAPARYPDPAGRDDPQADLIASIRLARSDPDFGCRFPLRAEALADAGIIAHPTRLMAGGCPAFERWAAIDGVDGIELVFATPSFADAATTAGHILFRVRARADRADAAPPAEAVWSYGVDLDRPEAASGRLFKGLVGALRGEVLAENARALDRRYGVIDRRDLYVYDLDLDRRALRLLLARLWVQQRDGSVADYAFFSGNCARMTHDTLRAVLPELRPASGWFMHPHQVLTELWRAGRVRPRGIVYSRRSRARRAEATRERLAPGLGGVPGFTAAHRARGPDRGAAVAAIGHPEDPALRAALTRWADATVDLELYVADAAGLPPEAPDPALDAALSLRARLPPDPAPRLEPFPPYAAGPSGSRRITGAVGHDGGALITRLRMGVVDEQPGEMRAIALRRSARFEFLLTELTLGWSTAALDWPAVRQTRLTLLSTVDYATHVRAVDGPIASRLDLLLDFGAQTAPAHGLRVGGWLRAGEVLTLLTAEDDAGFWVLGLDGQLVGGLVDDGPADPLRGELGLSTEVIAPLSAAHHLRLSARAAPGWGFDGFAVDGAADLRLDLLLNPGRPVFLSPYGRLRRGGVTGDGWEAGLALSL